MPKNKFLGKKVEDVHPTLKGIFNLEFRKLDLNFIVENCEFVFLTKPHGKAMEYVLKLKTQTSNLKIVDFSGDFRLKDFKIYEQWYGVKHIFPDLLKDAVYGLPEIYFDEIKKANFVANPGCYPTSIILALAPLLKEKVLDIETIVINSFSGLSGAGKSVTNPSIQLFIEASGNIIPYNVGRKHKHIPEIEQQLSKIAGESVKIIFTPYVASFSVGMMSIINVKANEEINDYEIFTIFKRFYEKKPFVRIYEPSVLPKVLNCVGTNFCDVGFIINKNKKGIPIVSLIAVIDNLIKGASGQAMQNMNIMCGFDETTGFPLTKLV